MNCLNHPDRPRVAFCQNCGKPLCSECARVVGSAVFCEPCLEARLAAANGPFSAAAGSAPPPFSSGPTTAGQAGGDAAYTAPGTGTPYTGAGAGQVPGAHNPALALSLGFIPGVGAMYNGQYAKGVVHLVVFAVLVSLADQHGIFGLFIAGWIAYQAFEAYHTAKALRDGTPLPNPFGLNDLGERLGFGKAWAAPPGGSPASKAATSGAGVPPPATAGAAYQGAPAAPMPDAAAQAPYSAPEAAPFSNPYVAAGTSYSGAAAAGGWGAPAESYVYPDLASGAGAGSSYGRRPSRFPVGAIVLIGLGVLFLIGNAGWMEGFPIHRLLPFLLIGLGFWIFARKMLDTGSGLADDGTPGYRLRVYRALRGSIWVMLVGLLFLLDSFRILSWGRSWPLFIIVGGVVAILERTAYTSAGSFAYPAPPIPPAPVNPSSPPPVVPTAVVSTESASHDAGEV